MVGIPRIRFENKIMNFLFNIEEKNASKNMRCVEIVSYKIREENSK